MVRSMGSKLNEQQSGGPGRASRARGQTATIDGEGPKRKRADQGRIRVVLVKRGRGSCHVAGMGVGEQ